MPKQQLSRRFAFRPLVFSVTVLLVALGIVLGNWQSGRATQKLALQAQLAEAGKQAPLALDAASVQQDPAPLLFRRVSLTGHFVDWPVALNNRPWNGRAGFYLVMPFQLAGSNMHVLVARGWLPRKASDPTSLPPYQTPAGDVRIEGVVRSDLGHIMQLGDTAAPRPGAIVQNLSVAQFQQASGLTTAPFFVEQLGAASEGLVRDWPAPALGVEKHQGYAFQWYALSAMAALFFVMTGFRRGPSRSK